jgi:hypothetical protein
MDEHKNGETITAGQLLRQIEQRLPRRLPDDPAWCGHGYVNRRSWACDDCGHPATDATIARLEAALQDSDPAHVWVLVACEVEDEDVDLEGMHPLPEVLAVVGRTSQLPRVLLQTAAWFDADDLRGLLRRATWLQSVFAPHTVTGFDPGDGLLDPATFSLSFEPVAR